MKCAKYNFNKFLKCCEELGLKLENTNIVKSIVNIIPKSYQKTLMGKMISSGIYVNHFM